MALKPVTMPDSFAPFEGEYNDWCRNGFPGCKTETLEFIEHFIQRKEGAKLWPHQRDAILRVIFSYEIRKDTLQNKYLLKIVTGGGKSLIIAALIAWLKYAYINDIEKFLIITPNLIVRDRLEEDFVRNNQNNMQTIFERWDISPDKNLNSKISATVLKSGGGTQQMLTADIILSNIQELYTSGKNTVRNLDYINTKTLKIAIFNDEAHNSVADEFSKILKILEDKTEFRVDTTATPERADDTYPNSKLIYSFNITDAMEANPQIIKNIEVFQPEARIVELTYTNAITNEKKKISELSKEFEECEKRIKPFNWIMDPAPMKMLISIALNALEGKKKEANGKYKPLLFVVTMGIAEAKKAKQFLEKEFNIKTLLVTEESSEEEREEARAIGSLKSEYQAVVSIFMLREGWDVSEVSVILLLRRIISPVYGQQIIGRGLRKIAKNSQIKEMLYVVDHPMLQHDWLWKMMNVTRIRQNILTTDVIEPEPLPPTTNYIQKLVNLDKFIKIKEPIENSLFQTRITEIRSKLIDEAPLKNWREVLDKAEYVPSESLEITGLVLDRIKKKKIGKRFGEELDILDTKQIYNSEEIEKYTIDDLKGEILSMAQELIEENGYGIDKISKLYEIVLDHLKKKLFNNKSLGEISEEEIKLVLSLRDSIKGNFTKGILKGIFMEAQ